ncbi:MAG: DNA-3-methyladenine glycosylase [Acidimicrobiales bacterium]
MSESNRAAFCTREYFARPSDVVARELVGSLIVVRDNIRVLRAMIVETEAYGGLDDAASHAFRGPTPRTAVMFGPAGYLYVYLSYGIHWCVNVVTDIEGVANAVLLRAAEIVSVEVNDAEVESHSILLRGPGNFSKGLGITGADSGSDCCDEIGSRISFRARPRGAAVRVARSRRIGISKEQERLSRYFLEGNPAVSQPRTPSSPSS